MGAKPSIGIVGAGNLGSALADFLQGAGYKVEVIKKSRRGVSRGPQARPLAKVVWFCVPDGEIARAAEAFAATSEWSGKIALHSSGALSSSELEALCRQGAAVASVHPLMTFVRGSRPSLAGVPFAIEGDAAAARMARRIVKDLGGQPYILRREDKAAYHAWATFASPLLTAFLATTERMAVLAGIKPKAARLRMMPILKQTLVNYGLLGAAKGFSGPIVRGDVDTIARHLRILHDVPQAREVYSALARAALQYLPARKRKDLMNLLRD
jgi:predicted short-subunit dehydrogenase-like oxidoreductase (DUF2520 family)